MAVRIDAASVRDVTVIAADTVCQLVVAGVVAVGFWLSNHTDPNDLGEKDD